MAIRLHIKQGTALTRGIADRELDAATVRFRDDGRTNNSAIRSAAIAEALAAYGTMHHEITDLPVQRIRADLTSTRGRVWGQIDCYRDPTSNPTLPGFAGAQVEWYTNIPLTKYRARTVGDPDYFDIDQPTDVWVAGIPPTDPDAIIRPDAIELQAPVFQVLVRAGRLTADPVETVADLCGAVNADAIKIRGFNCNPRTVRFIGPVGPTRDQDGTPVYATTYLFHYSPRGWNHWQATKIWNPGNTPGAGWYFHISERRRNEQEEDFVDAFPLASGTGPAEADGSGPPPWEVVPL